MDLTVIEPGMNFNWVVSNSIRGKCIAVNSNALIELIHGETSIQSLETKELNALLTINGILNSDCSDWSEDHDHWWKRGWHPSLEFYLWSLQVDYIDLGSNPQINREKKLAEYESQSMLPKPFKWSGEGLSLKDPKELSRLTTTGGDVIVNRRTIRRFKDKKLEGEIISSILWYALDSIRKNRLSSIESGILGLLQSFGIAFHIGIAAFNLDDIPAGIYGYEIEGHKLFRVSSGNYRKNVSRILMNQPPPSSASLTIFLIVDYPLYFWRYRHARALRNIYIEAGRIAQSIIISAEMFGLKTFPTPAIKDGLAASLFNIDESRLNVIHSISIGFEMSIKN